MTTYTTRDGDTVDSIAWRVYGSASADIPVAILEANRGLADHGPALPPGLSITLPEIVSPTKTQGVRLWD